MKPKKFASTVMMIETDTGCDTVTKCYDYKQQSKSCIKDTDTKVVGRQIRKGDKIREKKNKLLATHNKFVF